MKKEANFYGLDMIPLYIELTGGQLQEALTLLEHLESCQNKPHVLDDVIVNRVIKLSTEQKEILLVPLKQCVLWRDQSPTPDQLENIEKVEHYTQRLQKTIDKILFLANPYKGHTIDRILEKDEAELTIDYLLGKPYSPLGDSETKDMANDKEPWGPGSHHDYKIFNNPNEKGIKNLYQIKVTPLKSSDLLIAEWYQEYVQARVMINDFHEKVYQDGIGDIVQISKELGNYDPVDGVAVIQNDSEMNVFYDYFSLYRETNGQRFVSDWLMRNPSALTKNNEALVMGYTKARFSVLRIEKNLLYGAIHVVDVISQTSYVLIDTALNNSKKEGCFFCCSIIDRGDYIMTTGGGILIDGTSPGGKAILTLVIDQLDLLKHFTVLTPEIARCVRKIYGFCLRNGALSGMTANDTY